MPKTKLQLDAIHTMEGKEFIVEVLDCFSFAPEYELEDSIHVREFIIEKMMLMYGPPLTSVTSMSDSRLVSPTAIPGAQNSEITTLLDKGWFGEY